MDAPLTPELKEELKRTAEAMVAPGKGILAAGEGSELMAKRFAGFGVENNEENRRQYRQLLFTSGADMAKSISAVIVSNETLYQKADDGTPFVNILKDQGIILGVNVQKGFAPIMGTAGEMISEGLDGLAERCSQYKTNGCNFAKWQSVFKITESTPSELAIEENANVLARCAAICQQNGLVFIAEPNISSDGDHPLERSQQISEAVISALYKAFVNHHVYLEGTLLKTNMVIPGLGCTTKYTSEQIARASVAAMQRTVPVAVPGIGFVSGGQSDERASINLNAINQYQAKKPWALTFCFSRGLQVSALKAWSGKADQVKAGQVEFLKRAAANGAAAKGQYHNERSI